MLSIAFMPYHAIPPAGAYFHQRTIRTFIQRSRLSLVARSSSDIASSQINIPITYQHAATQVVVAIAGGENITLNKILSATITPPKPGAIMDLSTGIITSEVSYDKAADMGINDFTVQYIMLPVKSSSPMTLTLELMVNGESFSRTTPLRSLHPTTSCQPEIHTFSGQLSMKTPSHSPMSV